MSSNHDKKASTFVSGGTIDAPIERDAAWLAAQKELEAERAHKAALARPSTGRSLFETLEANKAAKQDAFEEANKIKNQFRALDADEVDFLDSVLESTRREEEKVKRETREGLEEFRKLQDEADKKAREGEGKSEGPELVGEDLWGAGAKKRKRVKDKEVLRGVKIRRTSTAEKSPVAAVPELEVLAPAAEKQPVSKAKNEGKIGGTVTSPTPVSKPSAAPPKPVSALVDYGSDDDDDW